MNTKQLFQSVGILTCIGLGAGAAIGTGCLVPLDEHCGNHDGDQTCAEQGGGFCNACDPSPSGCVDVKPEPDCYYPGPSAEASTSGGNGTVGGGDGTVGVATASGESDSGLTTGPAQCGECPPENPVCDNGVCVPCVVDDDCAGNEAGLVCAGGSCVQCTGEDLDACSEVTPICNGSSNTCVASCTSHEDCGDAACNLHDEYCFPATTVVHVGPGQDFFSIAAAVNSFGPGEQGTVIVHDSASVDPVDIDDGRMVAILAESIDDSPPTWNGGMGPKLEVTNGTVYLDGIKISGVEGMTPAIELSGTSDQARVWADRSRIVDNAGGGILVENGAELTLRNCFVGGNDGSVDVLEVDTASAHVHYSTLIAGSVTVRALLCQGTVDIEASDSVFLKYGNGDPIFCSGMLSMSNNASEQDLGPNNTNLGNSFGDGNDWFTDVAAGDFTLTPAGDMIFAGLAEWNTGDSPTDILGTSRPADGMPDHAGAHIP